MLLSKPGGGIAIITANQFLVSCLGIEINSMCKAAGRWHYKCRMLLSDMQLFT
jgi:hypothetical protein